MKDKTPGFDVVNLNPSFIIGKNELAKDVESTMPGTNKVLLGQVLGVSSPVPRPGTTVYLDDIARLHALALNKQRVPGNSQYPANSGGLTGTTIRDAKEVVARKFKDSVGKSRVFPNDGKVETAKIIIDTSRTEEVFGIKFHGVEMQITEVAQHYLELVGKQA